MRMMSACATSSLGLRPRSRSRAIRRALTFICSATRSAAARAHGRDAVGPSSYRRADYLMTLRKTATHRYPLDLADAVYPAAKSYAMKSRQFA